MLVCSASFSWGCLGPHSVRPGDIHRGGRHFPGCPSATRPPTVGGQVQGARGKGFWAWVSLCPWEEGRGHWASLYWLPGLPARVLITGQELRVDLRVTAGAAGTSASPRHPVWSRGGGSPRGLCLALPFPVHWPERAAIRFCVYVC